MGVRGPKPTATVVKLVTGNPGNRPLPKDEPQPKSSLGKRPAYLTGLYKGRATALWNEVSALAWWLGDVDVYKLGVWCEMQAKYERRPESRTPAFTAQLRALGSELGFDPASRTRIKGDVKSAPPGKDKYFDT